MAIVTTTVTLSNGWQPYERPPQQWTQATWIPRGLRTFDTYLATLDAKPINDDQTLIVTTGNLSLNFGYRLAHLYCSFDQDVAFSWNNEGTLDILNGIPSVAGTTIQRFVLTLRDIVIPGTAADEREIARMDHGGSPFDPNQPLWRAFITAGTTQSVSMRFTNSADPAGAAGEVTAGIHLWEYELEALHRWPVNAGIPVTQR